MSISHNIYMRIIMSHSILHNCIKRQTINIKK